MFQHLLQPAHQVLECISAGDVVDKKGTDGASVVRASDTSEGFLASSIPDLQLYRVLTINGDRSRTEFNSNRQVVSCFETLVCKLQQKAALSDRGVSHDDILEDVGVGGHL